MDDTKHNDEQLKQETLYNQDAMKIPVHLKHRPILGVQRYEKADGQKAGDSEAKGLSIGLAQWNQDAKQEVSAKIWRHTGEKWSRQSEEMALHRIVDLTILIARTRLLFKRYKPTKLVSKPGYPLIDELKIQGETLPVSACVDSETFTEDVEVFEKAMQREEVILKERFAILTNILSETEKTIKEREAEEQVLQVLIETSHLNPLQSAAARQEVNAVLTAPTGEENLHELPPAAQDFPLESTAAQNELLEKQEQLQQEQGGDPQFLEAVSADVPFEAEALATVEAPASVEALAAAKAEGSAPNAAATHSSNPPVQKAPGAGGAETRKRWYQNITVKDGILTAIAFISLMIALFVVGANRSMHDMSLEVKDIIITPIDDETVDLWIRQKNGIESVMLTRQILDYGTGAGHFACIDPGSHLAGEGEKRIVEGVFFGADEKGYPLVDSTTEKHPKLGAAYHLVLPREILYQTRDGGYHSTVLYSGSPITITAFRKDFADYTGAYRINPFTLQVENWPAANPVLGTYSYEAMEKEREAALEDLEARLREEFQLYSMEQEQKLELLRSEGLQVANSVTAELKQADLFMKEEWLRIVSEMYASLEAAMEKLAGTEAAKLLAPMELSIGTASPEVVKLLAEQMSAIEEELAELKGLKEALVGEDLTAAYLFSGEAYLETAETAQGLLPVQQAALDQLEARLREEFGQYLEEQKGSLAQLQTEGSQTADRLETQIAGLEEQLRTAYAEENTRLLEQAQETVAGLQAADSEQQAVLDRITAELYASLETSVAEIKSGQEEFSRQSQAETASRISKLEEQLKELAASAAEAVEASNDESVSAREQQVAKLEDKLSGLEKQLENQKKTLEAQNQAFTSKFTDVYSRGDLTNDEVEALKEARDAAVEQMNSLQILITDASGELQALRNAVMVFHNMGVFGSIRPIGQDVVNKVLDLKKEKPELTQKEVISTLEREGFHVSSYEMFLIFSIYFNEYKL